MVLLCGADFNFGSQSLSAMELLRIFGRFIVSSFFGRRSGLGGGRRWTIRKTVAGASGLAL
jgi:hypothetical protein